MLFETKIKYQKLDQNGRIKNVTETFIVEAETFGNAEEQINKEMEPYISGDFMVKAVKISNYAEIILRDHADKFFKCKVSFISIDEEKGLERKSNTLFLVRASDIDEAKNIITMEMKDTVSDYDISAVSETNILDVFMYGDLT